MTWADDFSVAANGDVRHTSGSTNYTVLQMHQALEALADDAQSSGDDLVDITTETPSDRSTDNIIKLNVPYNIDDTAARFHYDGSITQNDGDDVYSGLEVVGVIVAATEFMILQDNKVLVPFWGTGINANAATQLITSMLVKTRSGGADIDGKRILTLVREFGGQYREFPTTLGLANSVSAVSTENDLNNATAATTVRGWTTIGNTEGFQELDIDGTGASGQEFYAQLTKGSQTLNDTFEWTKLQQARSLVTLSGADTGSDFVLTTATLTAQAQSFTNFAVDQKLTEARFDLKIGGGTPTGVLIAELYASAGGVIPTGSALAISEEVLASLITSSYQEIIFRFNDNVTMTASVQYCIVIRHATGDATDFFHCDGSVAGGSVAGENNANEDPAATWNAVAAADLKFTVKASPVWHERAGEIFRGPTHEVAYDTESGSAFTEDTDVFWGARITYDGESGAFEVGRYVFFGAVATPTVSKNGGKILFDDTAGNVLYVALEDVSGGILLDNDKITQIGGTAASADIATTIVDDDKGGGIGRLLAIDDNTGTGELYMQLISGVAPVDGLRMSQTLANFNLVNATIIGHTISPEFIGATTGTNLIGAYGIGFLPGDVGASDKFFDLSNTQRTPPNNVTFSYTGLVAGEDRVLVGPRTGTALNKSQFTTDVGLTSNNETIVSIATVAIPTDTPTAGDTTLPTRLRIERDSGKTRRQPYSSYDGSTPGNLTMDLPVNAGTQIDVVAASGTFTRLSGSFLDDGFDEDCRFTGSLFAQAGNNATFTIATVTALVITVVDNTGMVNETGSGDELLTAIGWDYSIDQAASGNNVFVAYIDVLADATTESYTAVYNSDRDLFGRVRDGGGTPIKTSEATSAVFGSVSSSIAATRISDA